MAAMTFLQLVQKLRQKTGGASDPTTVVAQTGEAKDYVDWINEAWANIQSEEADWKWMRKDASFATTAGKNFYLPSNVAGETGVTDLAKWLDDDTWRMYRTALGRVDEGFLVPWSYQAWRDTFDFGLQSTLQNRPSVFAIRDKDRAILLGDNPNDIYTVTGQYQSTPAALAVDSDVPGLPDRFHMLIVYRAMVLYAGFEAAVEVYNEGKEQGDKLMAALRLDQLDTISLGAPLA